MCELLEIFLSASTALGTLAAAGATAYAAFQAKKAAQISEKISQDSEKDSQLEIFLKFSNEYDDIKKNFPRWPNYVSYTQGQPGLDQHNMEAALTLLKLFEKEYFLWSKKFVSNEMWHEVLEPKIVKFSNMEATKYTWSKKAHYKNFEFSDKFEAYLAEKMKA
ncbi:MAG: hypothetical protein INF43_05925 [Alphaproteobacteria bacterium]|nr:hypothetical protein [Alphaproteobacteria bacterium]